MRKITIVGCKLIAASVLCSTVIVTDASAQIYSRSIKGSYETHLDISYARIAGGDLRLDVYARTDSPGPHPTLIWFHAGGAMGQLTPTGKSSSTLQLLPYLEWGWNVVNVEWSLPVLTTAPLAAQNARCALRWVGTNAEKYGFDPSRVVLSGFSGGAWLALMTAMPPTPAPWESLCPGADTTKVAAVVSWSAPTDFTSVLQGPDAKAWAADWFYGLTNRAEMAALMSPVNAAAPSTPPVIIIHGDADPVVPFTQAKSLHDALKRLGVEAQLVAVAGEPHVLSRKAREQAFAAVAAFLAKLRLPTQ